MLVAKYKDVKNEIRYILYRSSRQNEHDTTIKRHENRIQILLETKDKIKDELVHYRNAYSHIDEIFTIEIKNAEKNPTNMILRFFLFLCRTKKVKSHGWLKKQMQKITQQSHNKSFYIKINISPRLHI